MPPLLPPPILSHINSTASPPSVATIGEVGRTACRVALVTVKLKPRPCPEVMRIRGGQQGHSENLTNMRRRQRNSHRHGIIADRNIKADSAVCATAADDSKAGAGIRPAVGECQCPAGGTGFIRRRVQVQSQREIRIAPRPPTPHPLKIECGKHSQ